MPTAAHRCLPRHTQSPVCCLIWQLKLLRPEPSAEEEESADEWDEQEADEDGPQPMADEDGPQPMADDDGPQPMADGDEEAAVAAGKGPKDGAMADPEVDADGGAGVGVKVEPPGTCGRGRKQRRVVDEMSVPMGPVPEDVKHARKVLHNFENAVDFDHVSNAFTGPSDQHLKEWRLKLGKARTVPELASLMLHLRRGMLDESEGQALFQPGWSKDGDLYKKWCSAAQAPDMCAERLLELLAELTASNTPKGTPSSSMPSSAAASSSGLARAARSAAACSAAACSAAACSAAACSALGRVGKRKGDATSEADAIQTGDAMRRRVVIIWKAPAREHRVAEGTGSLIHTTRCSKTIGEPEQVIRLRCRS